MSLVGACWVMWTCPCFTQRVTQMLIFPPSLFPAIREFQPFGTRPLIQGGGVFSLPVAAANARLGAWVHAGCRSLTGLSTQHSARGLPHTHPGLVLPGMHSVRNCRNNALPTQGI